MNAICAVQWPACPQSIAFRKKRITKLSYSLCVQIVTANDYHQYPKNRVFAKKSRSVQIEVNLK